jgi:hypothetical protein
MLTSSLTPNSLDTTTVAALKMELAKVTQKVRPDSIRVIFHFWAVVKFCGLSGSSVAFVVSLLL